MNSVAAQALNVALGIAKRAKPPHFTDIALIEQAAFTKAVEKAKYKLLRKEGDTRPVKTRPLTPVETGEAQWFYLVCRAKCAMQPAAKPATAQSTSASGTEIKLSSVICQHMNGVIPAVETEQRKQYDDEFKDKTGDYPSPEEECSIEQLVALAHMLKQDRAPYAEFAIWGPHFNRIQRKLKFTAHITTPEGKHQKVEISGPEKLDRWLECWTTYECATISIQAFKPTTLNRYRRFIEGEAKEYPAHWYLVVRPKTAGAGNSSNCTAAST